jgi:cellulose synthase/poly-beta-1,6-N-acetylglucosamine synthase-like glycosyltransferase
MYKKFFIGSLAIILLLFSCAAQKTDKKTKPQDTQKTDSLKNAASEQKVKVSECDSMLWLHVWNPPRLKVYQSCITATGTIAKIKAEDDGDTHMLLDLDEGQENLLNEGNMMDKKGYLVIEVICVNEVTDKKAKGFCDGYTNKVTIPNKGDHVRVTGSYVLDTHNDWMEIHPVSKIEVIK